MSVVLEHREQPEIASDELIDGTYVGQRMTADEFFQISDDDSFYELVDGVVIVSPSPTPRHQGVSVEITGQIWTFLLNNPIGRVLTEVDVHLGKLPDGKDLIYRPEVVFIIHARLPADGKRISGPPDVVVEVISQGSRRMDTVQKFKDYERFGVREYWLMDPERDTMRFYRLEGTRFVEVRITGDEYVSQAIPGFRLDLVRVRQAFKAW